MYQGTKFQAYSKGFLSPQNMSLLTLCSVPRTGLYPNADSKIHFDFDRIALKKKSMKEKASFSIKKMDLKSVFIISSEDVPVVMMSPVHFSIL
jgi:hypothetical protein